MSISFLQLRRVIKKLLWAVFALLLGLGMTTASARLPAEVNGQPLPSLADMLDKIKAAVVSISTESSENPTALKDPVLRHYFGSSVPARKKGPQGTGSGIILDAFSGYVVTNAHVIEGAEKIIVTLIDKRQFYATLIGKDLKSDIAVLRIEPDELTDLPVADSAALRVGDFVVAIGNPYGLGQSVSSGIVSALGRSNLGIEDYEDFIQTDAAINPGNSGGALVNLKGELVGINTAILGGRDGGTVGIGFAIPSNMVSNIKKQLIKYGKVERGQLGIEIQDIYPDRAKQNAWSGSGGALIAGVVKSSPAYSAGIREGDIVTRVNGIRVTNSAKLRTIIGNLRLGSNIDVEFLRDGVTRKSSAVIGKVNHSDYEQISTTPQRNDQGYAE